jgi:hypothetical protein
MQEETFVIVPQPCHAFRNRKGQVKNLFFQQNNMKNKNDAYMYLQNMQKKIRILHSFLLATIQLDKLISFDDS